ncbi:MAG: hypothetical protein ACRD2U_13975 [Terriglobales bacterium]
MKKTKGGPQITSNDPEHLGSRRDPEERRAQHDGQEREKSFDKTLADSFPSSDPASSIPDPDGHIARTSPETSDDRLLVGLKAGSWAALSIDGRRVVGTGATQEEAEADARKRHQSQVELVQVPAKKAS